MTIDINTIFTFGSGHECVCGRPLRNSFTLIAAHDREAARDLMFARWKNKWAFDYPTEEDAGVERWHLQYVPTNLDDLTRCPCGDALVTGVDANGSEVSL